VAAQSETKNGNDPARGTAYNAGSGRLQRVAMQELFRNIFQG
jgi:hypothetical protein